MLKLDLLCTFYFKVIFNFIDFSIAKVGRPSQSCAENYFQMILLLLVLLGHKVVSSLGALLGQPPAARHPLPAGRRYSSRARRGPVGRLLAGRHHR